MVSWTVRQVRCRGVNDKCFHCNEFNCTIGLAACILICVQILSFTMGWHCAIVGERAAISLLPVAVSAAANACVGCETITLQPRDLVHSMFYLNLKSDVGMHRIRRFL